MSFVISVDKLFVSFRLLLPDEYKFIEPSSLSKFKFLEKSY